MGLLIGSPTDKLKELPGLSMYVQSSKDPNNEPNINEDIPSSWAALLDMDCRRAIYYYLRWHSTTLCLCFYCILYVNIVCFIRFDIVVLDYW